MKISKLFMALLFTASVASPMSSNALEHDSNSCYANCVSTIMTQYHPQGACYQMGDATDRQNCINIVQQKTAENCKNGCLGDPNFLQPQSQWPTSAPQGNHDNPRLYPAQPQPPLQIITKPTPVRSKPTSVTGDRG